MGLMKLAQLSTRPHWWRQQWWFEFPMSHVWNSCSTWEMGNSIPCLQSADWLPWLTDLNVFFFFFFSVLYMYRYSVHRDIRALSVDIFRQFFALQVYMIYKQILKHGQFSHFHIMLV